MGSCTVRGSHTIGGELECRTQGWLKTVRKGNFDHRNKGKDVRYERCTG